MSSPFVAEWPRQKLPDRRVDIGGPMQDGLDRSADRHVDVVALGKPADNPGGVVPLRDRAARGEKM
jgi:hypothetical protein